VAAAKSGEELLITERGRPVARLVPVIGETALAHERNHVQRRESPALTLDLGRSVRYVYVSQLGYTGWWHGTQNNDESNQAVKQAHDARCQEDGSGQSQN
jgi:antitoxin (DNA-binding transcriptional repressor) of toxin-antitoxin stability system